MRSFFALLLVVLAGCATAPPAPTPSPNTPPQAAKPATPPPSEKKEEAEKEPPHPAPVPIYAVRKQAAELDYRGKIKLLKGYTKDDVIETLLDVMKTADQRLSQCYQELRARAAAPPQPPK